MRPRNSSPSEVETAKQVYAENRLYHGTTSEAKNSLRNHGFNFDKKSTGAAHALSKDTRQSINSQSMLDKAEEHHYLSSSKEKAQFFSRWAAWGNTCRPAVIRAIDVQSTAHVEIDPDIPRNDPYHNACFRTKDNIEADHVLDSKSAEASEGESRVFKNCLSNAGLNVSQKRAGELLREVQSDSDDD